MKEEEKHHAFCIVILNECSFSPFMCLNKSDVHK